jgi:hypothetical protein
VGTIELSRSQTTPFDRNSAYVGIDLTLGLTVVGSHAIRIHMRRRRTECPSRLSTDLVRQVGVAQMPAARRPAFRSLLPKMSAVVFRTLTNHCEPQSVVHYFGEENLPTVSIGLNSQAWRGVAWCVVERRTDAR